MAVPLAATLAILLATFFQENDRAILDVLNTALPYQSARLTANLRDFIESARAISGVGLAVLLATSLRLIFVIENTVNFAWGAPRRKGVVKRVAVYTLGLFVGAILTGVLIDGLAQLRRQAAIENLFASALFGRLLSAIAVAGALTLLYRFLPNARVTWQSAAVAALLVAFALRVIRIGFAYYLRLFNTMNVIYGSLSLLLVVLIALFLFWVLLLGGVELTFVLDAGAGSAAVAAGQGKIEAAVRLLLCVLKSGGAKRPEDLPKELGQTSTLVEPLAARLTAAGLLRPAGKEMELADRPERITLSRVMSAVEPDLLAVSPENNDFLARILRRQFRKFAKEREVLLDVTLARLAERE
jgi:YihY family inner membrane protein